MFFKKKRVLGTVTIFEENDIVAEDKFNDLGDDAKNADQLDIMTATQMKDLAIANARAGKEATARTLRLANEANQIGIETAEKLHGQTKQLEQMGDDFVVVHDYLDKTERVVNKMRKPRFLRMFQRKKGRKQLEMPKIAKHEQAAKVQVRRNGVDAIQLERQRGSRAATVLTMDDLAGDLSSSSDSCGRSQKKDHVSAPSFISYGPKNDQYSEYDDDVADVLRDQDDDLEDLSDTLAGMRDVAVAMNNELDHQNDLISQVQDYTEQTKGRTMENARKIRLIE